MRISDWSSDVCSSDLRYPCENRPPFAGSLHHNYRVTPDGQCLSHPSLLTLEAVFHIVDPADDLPVTPARCKRSEEHTSELQSLMRISYAVFCLKKKKHTTYTDKNIYITHNTYIINYTKFVRHK